MQSYRRAGLLFISGVVCTWSVLSYTDTLSHEFRSVSLQASLLGGENTVSRSENDVFVYDVQYSTEMRDEYMYAIVQWGNVLQPSVLKDAFDQGRDDTVSFRLDFAFGHALNSRELSVNSPFPVTYALSEDDKLSVYIAIDFQDINAFMDSSLSDEDMVLVALMFPYEDIPLYQRNVSVILTQAWLQLGQDRENLIVEKAYGRKEE